MIILGIVVGVLGLIVYEVRADRRVRRSAAGAQPVVVVRGLRPRWWRLLLGKAFGFALSVAAFTGLGLLVWHLAVTAAPADAEHTWPMPGASAPLSPAMTGTGAAR